MSANCSDVPPYSNTYLHELPLAELVVSGGAAVICVGVIALFLDKVCFIYRHYGSCGRHRRIRDKSMFIVGVYPVAAFSSLLSVFIPRATLLSDLITTMYLAACLYQFTTLLILYCGGRAQLIKKSSTSGLKLQGPPCCCCCFCCPTIVLTSKNLHRLQLLVLQTALVQPITSFVSMVLWLDGEYVSKASLTSASTYLSALGGLSTLLAMYGLVAIFRAARDLVGQPHGLTPKFLVLQLVLAVESLQKLVFKMLAGSGIPACLGTLSSSVRADVMHHRLVVAEMFLLALLARVFYRRPIAIELLAGYAEIEVSVSDETRARLTSDPAQLPLGGNSSGRGGCYDATGQTNHSSTAELARE